MAWNDIVSDEEFQAQPFETKRKVAENYFKRNIETQDFLSQPKEVQDKVRTNFMARIGEKPFSEKAVSTLKETAKGFVSGTFSAFNQGFEAIADTLDSSADAISKATGLPKGGLFEKAKAEYTENAAYWDKKFKESGPDGVAQFVTKFVGGLAPGVAGWEMGVPFAAQEGWSAAEEAGTNPYFGAAKGAIERALTGGIFKAVAPLSRPARVAALSGTMGAQALAEGKDIPEALATGAGLGLMGGAGRPTQWRAKIDSVLERYRKPEEAVKEPEPKVEPAPVAKAIPPIAPEKVVKEEVAKSRVAGGEAIRKHIDDLATRVRGGDEGAVKELHDVVKESMKDKVSGAGNQRSFDFLEKVEGPAPYILSMDVKGLHAVDKLLGQKAGDDYLRALNAVHEEEGVDAHRYGEKSDEFLSRHQSLEEAEAAKKRISDRFKQMIIEVPQADGTSRYFTNLEFYAGIGGHSEGKTAHDAAFDQLYAEKRAAQSRPEYSREALPGNIVELTPEEFRARQEAGWSEVPPAEEKVSAAKGVEVGNLRPAIAYSGKPQFVGKEGQTHDEVLNEKGMPLETGDRGFVDPKGNFLTRDEALDWMLTNQPEAADKLELRGGELHSKEYAEATGITKKTAVEAIKAAETREPTDEELRSIEAETTKALDELDKELAADPKLSDSMSALDVINRVGEPLGISPVESRLKAEKEEVPTAPRTFIEPPAFKEGIVEKPTAEINKEMESIKKQMDSLRKELSSEEFEGSVEDVYNKLDSLEERYRVLNKSLEASKKPGFVSRMLGSERGAIGDLGPAPAFYSQLERVVEAKIPNKAEAYVVKRILENPQNAIKQDELKWTGIDEWLKEQKGTVTKQQVLDFVKQGQVRIKEVIKGEGIGYPTKDEVAQDLYDKNFSELDEDRQADVTFEWDARIHGTGGATGRTVGIAPKYSQYKTPGGENYRELLLTLPESVSAERSKYLELWNKAKNLGARVDEDGGLDLADAKRLLSALEYKDFTGGFTPDKSNYQSSHWDEPNVLAHVRTQDFIDSKGKKVLLIEEVQSDWAQEGRKKGFKTKEDWKDEYEIVDVNKYDWKEAGFPSEELFRKTWAQGNEEFALVKKSDGRIVETAHSKGGLVSVAKDQLSKSVPTMPFSKTWHELVMKRMLREAAEKGYDKVAWTTGEMQAERYDLSKQVDEVRYNEPSGLLVAYKDGKFIISKKIISNKDLEDTIGKDAAKRLLDAKEDSGIKSISGNDLKVGGEGMKGFYDRIIPDFMRKYTKKWGGEVEKTTIESEPAAPKKGEVPTELPSAFDVHSVSITPAMKSDVLYKGQALYSFPAGIAENLKTLKTEVVDPLYDFWARPPQRTDATGVVGKYTGDIQRYDLRLSKWSKKANETWKDPLARRAMSRYREADGDMELLRKRADAAKDSEVKKVYERALSLTDTEKAGVAEIGKLLDSGFNEAVNHGILKNESFIDNYIAHLGIERDNKIVKKLSAQVNAGYLAKDPSFAKKRIFDTLFDLEQAGYKQKAGADDIVFVATAWQRSLAEAISAREAVKGFSKAKMPDGRPMIYIGGAGKVLDANEAAGTPARVLVRANMVPEDAIDYVRFDHPSMRGVKYIGRDTNGKPVLMEGQMLVHPKAVKDLNSLLGKSWFKTYALPEGVPLIGGKKPFVAAAKVSGFIKGTMLIGPFHQIATAEHALFHGVNPFRAPALNLDGKVEHELVDHGLMVYNHNALAEFGEGLHSGGLPHWIGNQIKKAGEKLPEGSVIRKVTDKADFLNRYGEYLFQDYIPRLKMAMSKAALSRAERWYARELREGKITRDQLLDNVAKQSNAAFGELNYKYMGRDPSIQDGLRLATLAPDFLEARLKFAGQALRPYGREQQMAFLKGAIYTAVAAQILNVAFSDKHEPNWTKPFTVTVGKKDYTPRSVIGDVYHGITDPRGFALYRLNPLYGKGAYEVATGRDIQGKKLTPGEIVGDITKSWIPIPAQGFIKQGVGDTKTTAIMNGILSSLSVQSYRSLTKAEEALYDLRAQSRRDMTPEQKKRNETIKDIRLRFRSGKLKTMDDVEDEADRLGIALSPAVKKDIEMSKVEGTESEEYQRERLLSGRTVPELLRVWKLMTTEEKEFYEDKILLKIQNSQSLTFDEKEKAYEAITEPEVATKKTSRYRGD